MDFQISMSAARKNAGLTQTEIARQLGVSRTTIKNWECGTTAPRVDQFYKFCEICNIPKEHVFLPSIYL